MDLTNNLRLPISLDDVLQGKAVEWERLEYKQGVEPGSCTAFNMRLCK